MISYSRLYKHFALIILYLASDGVYIQYSVSVSMRGKANPSVGRCEAEKIRRVPAQVFGDGIDFQKTLPRPLRATTSKSMQTGLENRRSCDGGFECV